MSATIGAGFWRQPGEAVERWGERLTGCLASLALVAAAAAAGAVLQHGCGIDSPVLLVFLLAVFISASRYGLTASLLACLSSAAMFDFFFTEPLYSFTIGRTQDIIAFLVFCVVAVVASERAARLREQTLAAERRTAYVAALYRLGRTLAGSLVRSAAIEAVRSELAATLEAEVCCLPAEAATQGADPDECCIASAEAGGALLLRRPGRGFSDADRSLAGAMVGLLDLSLARLDLSARVEQAHIAAANQALTTTLLDSISHDLRSPLASIMAASETLDTSFGASSSAATSSGATSSGATSSGGSSFGGAGSAGDLPGAWAESLRTIRTEAERLNRLAANLLNMLRLDGGHVVPRPRIEDAVDVLSAVAARSGPLLARHRLRVEARPDLPWVQIDHALLEPVLFNLLENAAKFAPPGTVIELGARAGRADSIDIYVRDEGPGLPPEELDNVFRKFVRLPSDRGGAGRGGAGLGLAICRGFVAAMGGSIAAANRADRRGTVFTVTLPAVPAAAVPALADS